MLELILEFFTCLIRGVFLADVSYSELKMGNGIRKKIGYIFLYLVGYYIIGLGEYREYVLQVVYAILISYFFLKDSYMDKKLIFSVICVLLGVYEIIVSFSSIFATMIFLLLPFELEKVKIYGLIVAILLRSLIVYSVIKLIRKYHFKLETLERKCYLVYLCFLLIIFIRLPFIYSDIRDGLMLKIVFFSIACCTVIFLIISRIDKHNAEKERAKIEENNKKLSSKLHKSQEILPAMVQVLSNVTENGGTEMEEQEAHKLLEEVSDLYGQQLKENSKEDLQLKNFCSTGLKLLDEQLKVYQMEALDRNVNLDIFVQAPINGIMKKDNIDQLKLQRAVGDLIRNAFRVMEREDKKCRAKGHILLIIGCQYEGILEIAVVDNGAEFPLHVIQAFGRRGVTTGGTGNGLADLVEFADETKASIRVDEFAWETSSFTKKISIIFDKQRMNYFNSSRRELIESSFWNNN